MFDNGALRKYNRLYCTAIVPSLPGCVSQGDTRTEAIANIREAIEVYLEDCIESGEEIPREAGREIIDVESPA